MIDEQAKLEHRRVYMREYHREYRRVNAEAMRAHAREYRQANREAMRAYKREYRRVHKEQIASSMREYRRAHVEELRVQSRKNKLAKRVRRRGVYTEAINPIEVFSRDRWRCKACGCKTPRELRGTNEPNAPELDHVIPLKLGGPHTKANTQCLCRECNGKKWTKYEGQLAFA